MTNKNAILDNLGNCEWSNRKFIPIPCVVLRSIAKLHFITEPWLAHYKKWGREKRETFLNQDSYMNSLVRRPWQNTFLLFQGATCPNFVRGSAQEKNSSPGSRIFAFKGSPILQSIGQKYTPKHKNCNKNNPNRQHFHLTCFDKWL